MLVNIWSTFVKSIFGNGCQHLSTYGTAYLPSIFRGTGQLWANTTALRIILVNILSLYWRIFIKLVMYLQGFS